MDRAPTTEPSEAIGASSTSGTGSGSSPSSNVTAGGPTYNYGTTNVDVNLQTLRGLAVVEVLDVIVNIPQEANCYYAPCPGHESEFVSAEDARARAAQALADFTRTAVAAVSTNEPDLTGDCARTDEQNLQVLKDLNVVSLGAIIEAPQASNCYGVPRALKLSRIAWAVQKP